MVPGKERWRIILQDDCVISLRYSADIPLRLQDLVIFYSHLLVSIESLSKDCRRNNLVYVLCGNRKTREHMSSTLIVYEIFTILSTVYRILKSNKILGRDVYILAIVNMCLY
jgi:hypothetical protein